MRASGLWTKYPLLIIPKISIATPVSCSLMPLATTEQNKQWEWDRPDAAVIYPPYTILTLDNRARSLLYTSFEIGTLFFIRGQCPLNNRVGNRGKHWPFTKSFVRNNYNRTKDLEYPFYLPWLKQKAEFVPVSKNIFKFHKYKFVFLKITWLQFFNIPIMLVRKIRRYEKTFGFLTWITGFKWVLSICTRENNNNNT